jgi:hypothetical protein
MNGAGSKKGYLGRGLIFAAWLAVVGTAAAAFIGTARFGEVNLQAHVLISLVATMILFFTHLWVVIYLVGTRRALLSTAAAHGLAAEIEVAVRKLFWRGAPWALLGLLGLVLIFISGYARMADRGPEWFHLTAALVATLAQIAALVFAGKTLAENERWIRRVDAETRGVVAA